MIQKTKIRLFFFYIKTPFEDISECQVTLFTHLCTSLKMKLPLKALKITSGQLKLKTRSIWRRVNKYLFLYKVLGLTHSLHSLDGRKYLHYILGSLFKLFCCNFEIKVNLGKELSNKRKSGLGQFKNNF